MPFNIEAAEQLIRTEKSPHALALKLEEAITEIKFLREVVNISIQECLKAEAELKLAGEKISEVQELLRVLRLSESGAETTGDGDAD